jgi:hypothetical protein
MFRLYVISAFLAFGLYGLAQYRGWSMFGSDAEEFQRVRAERATQRTFGGSGGSGGGGSSGHK